jgi:hypothetical protein
MTVRTVHHVPVPERRAEGDLLAAQPAGRRVSNGHSDTLDQARSITNPASAAHPLDPMGAAHRESKTISRELSNVMSSHDRYGNFMVARNAALRLIETLNQLLASEESL